MNRRRPNPEALQRQCDQFNAHTPVGAPVVVRLDDGATLQTVVGSPAEVLSGHSAVIWLTGVRGCVSLDRVVPKVQA